MGLEVACVDMPMSWGLLERDIIITYKVKWIKGTPVL